MLKNTPLAPFLLGLQKLFSVAMLHPLCMCGVLCVARCVFHMVCSMCCIAYCVLHAVCCVLCGVHSVNA